MDSKARRASAVIAFGMPASLAVSADASLIGLGVLLGLVAVGAFVIPNFRSSMFVGLLGGAAAGVLVLGPGLRVAMRIVATMDPIRQPEFSIEGTGFIIVGAGIVGAVFGAGIALIREAFRITGPQSFLMVAAGGIAALLAGSELRGELLDLGAGAWVNIPIFAVVWGLHGLAVLQIINRARRRSKQAPLASVEV